MSIENYSVHLLEYAATDLKHIFGNKNKVCWWYLQLYLLLLPHSDFFRVQALIQIQNSPEGANSRIACTPIRISPVLSRSQIILAPSIVGLFIENPLTFRNAAGLNFIEMELLMDMWAVFCEFHHMASKIFLLVNFDSECTSMLEDRIFFFLFIVCKYNTIY